MTFGYPTAHNARDAAGNASACCDVAQRLPGAGGDFLVMKSGYIVKLVDVTQSPCPYKKGETRKLVVAVPTSCRPSHVQLGSLAEAGFARSGAYVTGNDCLSCRACVPVRIDVDRFTLSRTQRKLVRRNQHLVVKLKPVCATNEAYELYRRYHMSRHPRGAMANDTFQQYVAFADAMRSCLMAEFYDPCGRLVMVGVFDVMPDGLFAHHSWFDPDCGSQSLGTYNIIWLLHQSYREGKQHVYLGDWIDGHPSLHYKVGFRGVERFDGVSWR